MTKRARHAAQGASFFSVAFLAVIARADSPPTDPKEARRLYAEGARLYEQHDYAEAVNSFERAYALTNAPALLFNLAQAYRLLGPAHCGRALGYYEQYQRAEPDNPDRAEIRVHIADMRACASNMERAPKSAEAVAPSPAASPSAVAPAPVADGHVPASAFVWGSVGVVGLAVFGTMAILAYRSEQSLEQGCSPRCDPSDVDAMRSKYMAANLALAVGLVAIGATTYVVVTREPSAPATRARSAPQGAWIGVRGTF